jgi:hypothetical protein
MALKKTTGTSSPVQFVFGKSNYRLMLISIAVIVLGFMLMIGKTDIYDFRKVVLAPFVVLVGFAIGFVSILKKSENTK